MEKKNDQDHLQSQQSDQQQLIMNQQYQQQYQQQVSPYFQQQYNQFNSMQNQYYDPNLQVNMPYQQQVPPQNFYQSSMMYQPEHQLQQNPQLYSNSNPFQQSMNQMNISSDIQTKNINQQNYSNQYQSQMDFQIQQKSPTNQNDRVDTSSILHKNSSQMSTPKFPFNNLQQQNNNIGSQLNIQGKQQSSQNSNKGQTNQMQQIISNFFALIKKGEIEQIIQEMNKLQIDLVNLIDENSFKQNVIFAAAQIKDQTNSLKVMQIFKDLGVACNQKDSLSQTPLYYASREGHMNVINFLLEEGCDINHVDTYGQTAFFYSIREGHIEICKKMVVLGVNPDLVDNNGQTPLYYAIKAGKIDICEFLLKNGANHSVTDKKNQTPIQWAKRFHKQQVLDMLVEFGAPPPADSKNNKNNKKMPPPQKQKVNERKIPKDYVLTKLKNNQYEQLTEEEFEQFLQENPQLSKLFLEAGEIENLPVPDVPDNAQIYDCWDKAAKRLLNSLWKLNNAWIFHEPVDPIKLNIPDYFEIVKSPMDFGTIKQKLTSNHYLKFQDFLNDINQVFENCLLYNAENTQVAIMCKNVRDEYHKLYDNLYMNYYL